MVGMASQNGQRAIDLFGNNDLRQSMRQCHGAKRNKKVGLGLGAHRPSIRRAHGNENLLLSAVSSASNKIRELSRAERLAGAIK